MMMVMMMAMMTGSCVLGVVEELERIQYDA